MKLGTLLNPAFNQAFQDLIVQKIPLATGIKLRDISKTLSAKLESFNEARKALLTQYADKDDAGKAIVDDKGNVQLSDEAKVSFGEELEKAANEEFDVNTVTVAELGNNVVLTTQQIIILDDIVK